MADNSVLKETLLAATLTKNNTFIGLHNTKDLVDTVQGYFSGCTRKLTVMSVQGTTDKFKSAIALDVSSEDEFKNVLKLYMCNTDETLKVKYLQKGKNFTAVYLFIVYISCIIYINSHCLSVIYMYTLFLISNRSISNPGLRFLKITIEYNGLLLC